MSFVGCARLAACWVGRQCSANEVLRIDGMGIVLRKKSQPDWKLDGKEKRCTRKVSHTKGGIKEHKNSGCLHSGWGEDVEVRVCGWTKGRRCWCWREADFFRKREERCGLCSWPVPPLASASRWSSQPHPDRIHQPQVHLHLLQCTAYLGHYVIHNLLDISDHRSTNIIRSQ